MSTPMYEIIDATDARAEITRHLRNLGMSEDELNHLGEQYLLNEREYGIWRHIDALRWLLDGA